MGINCQLIEKCQPMLKQMMGDKKDMIQMMMGMMDPCNHRGGTLNEAREGKAIS
jgi:hypothetical protein